MKNTKLQRKRPAKASIAVYEHDGGATAVQGTAPDGSQFFVCDNLRVLVTKQHGVWLAQGLEIDYTAEGDTLKEAKKNFEFGLAATVESHLRVYNDIRPLLAARAPDERWVEYYDKKNTLRRFVHAQAFVTESLQRDLPFDRILWVEDKEAA